MKVVEKLGNLVFLSVLPRKDDFPRMVKVYRHYPPKLQKLLNTTSYDKSITSQQR